MKTYQILSLFSLIVLIFACGAEEPETTKPPQREKKVQTKAPERLEFAETVYATGQLASKEEVKMSFKTGGIVKRILVAEGESVRRGQLLAELDLLEIQAQNTQASLGIQQAEINISDAELAVSKAERDYQNLNNLYLDSVATLNQVKDAKLALDNAKNKLEAAQTNLKFNQKNSTISSFNLNHSKIIAPSNGIILRKVAESNEVVGPGTPILLFGSADKAQVIRVNLSDRDIVHVNLNDPAEIRFDAYPNQAFSGRVEEIGSIADPYTGTYEVEIAVDAAGKKLLSGFIGQVEIRTANPISLLRIPMDALIEADGNRGEVFIVEDGKALKTKVEVYKIEDSSLLISKGLRTDDDIIIKGAGYLKNEDPVLITQKQ
ncbi:MAG: efflux RND transporter periplasmic adaptor subunit [Bacteroidota bacterium]